MLCSTSCTWSDLLKCALPFGAVTWKWKSLHTRYFRPVPHHSHLPSCWFVKKRKKLLELPPRQLFELLGDWSILLQNFVISALLSWSMRHLKKKALCRYQDTNAMEDRHRVSQDPRWPFTAPTGWTWVSPGSVPISKPQQACHPKACPAVQTPLSPVRWSLSPAFTMWWWTNKIHRGDRGEAHQNKPPPLGTTVLQETESWNWANKMWVVRWHGVQVVRYSWRRETTSLHQTHAETPAQVRSPWVGTWLVWHSVRGPTARHCTRWWERHRSCQRCHVVLEFRMCTPQNAWKVFGDVFSRCSKALWRRQVTTITQAVILLTWRVKEIIAAANYSRENDQGSASCSGRHEKNIGNFAGLRSFRGIRQDQSRWRVNVQRSRRCQTYQPD